MASHHIQQHTNQFFLVFNTSKYHVGNVYEAGKLNVLTVIQLLNKALEILIQERRHIDKEALKLDLHYIEGKTKFQNETVLGLKSLRQAQKSVAYFIYGCSFFTNTYTNFTYTGEIQAVSWKLDYNVLAFIAPELRLSGLLSDFINPEAFSYLHIAWKYVLLFRFTLAKIHT